MLTLTIQRDDDEPVYEQVARQVRQFVASGALAPGTDLPSVRQLARDLGVGLNTIARAYRVLEGEGFLVTRDRAGVSVAAPSRRIGKATRTELLAQLRSVLAKLRQAGMNRDDLLGVLHNEVDALDVESGGGGK